MPEGRSSKLPRPFEGLAVSQQRSARRPKTINMHDRGGRFAALPPAPFETRAIRRQARGHARYERGQATAEFALALPLLLTVLFGVLLFGIAFNNDEALTFATNTGAQQLSISRGITTDPCNTVYTAAASAAPQLHSSNIKFTIVLNGKTEVSGATSPTCTSGAADLVQSSNAQVTATYPCNLNIFGLKPVPNCTLTAKTTVLVQ